MRLTQDQEQLIARALMQSFSKNELALMLRSRLGLFLEDISGKGTREEVVWDLIDWFRRQNIAERLLTAAQASRPHVDELRDLADQVLVPVVDDRVELERQISENVPDLDPAVFREKQETIEPAVCAITVTAKDVTGGTGFLVGRDLVLTAAHVLQPVIDGTTKLANAKFRFDYKKLREGHPATLGVTYGLADIVMHDGAIDFALARLDAPAGEEPIGSRKAEEGAPRRSWIALPETPIDYKPRSPLLILHHPRGEELKMAIETQSIVGLDSTHPRVTHKTNTDHGSSGSPCFDLSWTLLAVHRGTVGTANVAIPIAPVASAIRAKVKV